MYSTQYVVIVINDYCCSVYLQGCNMTIALVCTCSNYGKSNAEGWACSSGVEHLHSMNKTLAPTQPDNQN